MIFHSYVKLPEAIFFLFPKFIGGWKILPPYQHCIRGTVQSCQWTRLHIALLHLAMILIIAVPKGKWHDSMSKNDISRYNKPYMFKYI